jgi:hypothetical protein
VAIFETASWTAANWALIFTMSCALVGAAILDAVSCTECASVAREFPCTAELGDGAGVVTSAAAVSPRSRDGCVMVALAVALGVGLTVGLVGMLASYSLSKVFRGRLGTLTPTFFVADWGL